MKPKKILTTLALIIFISIPGFSSETTPVINATPRTASASQNRLEEIKAMDINSLSRQEKKSLRKEVRSIEKDMKKADNGGVYLSVGAIIIIVLLLILIL